MEAVQQIPTDIVIKGTKVVLDLERLDFGFEIPKIGVPDSIRSERDLVRQLELYRDWIERRSDAGEAPIISATSTVVEDENWKFKTLLIASKQELSEGRIMPAQRALTCDLVVELATWTGLSLASKRLFRGGGAHLHGVKIGMRALNGREANDHVRRGGSINIYRDYPARFHTDLVEGRRLLDLYGWRLGQHQDEWWLYEVGGPLERELALWLDGVADEQGIPEYKERAREICPSAFAPADEPEPRRKGRAS